MNSVSERPLIERQGADRFMVKLRASRPAQRLAGMLGETGQFNFRQGRPVMSVEEAIDRRDNSRINAASIQRRSTAALSHRGPRHRFRKQHHGRAGYRGSTHWRTGRNIPIWTERARSSSGNATLENVGQKIAIIVDETGNLRAIRTRADPRRQRPDFRQFTKQSARDIAVVSACRLDSGKFNVIEIGTERCAGESSLALRQAIATYSQSLSCCPSRPASSCVNWKATRPERLPRVVAHSSASARSVSASIARP